MQIRKKRLIKTSLQLKLITTFLCTAALAVQVEAICLGFTFSRIADKLPNDGTLLMSELPRFIATNVLLTTAVVFSLTLAFGIVATFPIAGPIYRFEQFLGAVKAGRQVDPCRIRKDDELQDFCTLLNDVTQPLRERAAALVSPQASPELDSVRPALPAAPTRSEPSIPAS